MKHPTQAAHLDDRLTRLRERLEALERIVVLLPAALDCRARGADSTPC